MWKILRNEELQKFINDLNIKYEDEIFSIILCYEEETKYIINGEKYVKIDKETLEKYL